MTALTVTIATPGLLTLHLCPPSLYPATSSYMFIIQYLPCYILLIYCRIPPLSLATSFQNLSSFGWAPSFFDIDHSAVSSSLSTGLPLSVLFFPLLPLCPDHFILTVSTSDLILSKLHCLHVDRLSISLCFSFTLHIALLFSVLSLSSLHFLPLHDSSALHCLPLCLSLHCITSLFAHLPTAFYPLSCQHLH